MGQGDIKVKKMRSVPIYIILGLLCAALMFPVYIAVILPFQASDELSQTITPLIKNVEEYIRIDFAAQYPTLEHFSGLLLYTPEFYTVFWNSLLMAGIILLFQIIVAIPSAWAFARLNFKGKNLLFNAYVLFMLMPFQITMLSQYIVLNNMELMNTRLAVILPAIFSTLPVFLIYRGFADIPPDVADSARIDGANEFQVLRYIGIPLGQSGILSCIVLSFLDIWNMVEQPLAFLKDKELYPLSLYLPTIDISNAEMLFAAAAVTLIPAAFVFIIGQDFLEQGIIATALKE